MPVAVANAAVAAPVVVVGNIHEDISYMKYADDVPCVGYLATARKTLASNRHLRILFAPKIKLFALPIQG
jgi:hypothetical protein